MWNCLELWFHCYHFSWAIKWCGRFLTVTVISHFTGDLSQLAAVPAQGKLSPCHLFKFQTLFCDQFQYISEPQHWPHRSWFYQKSWVVLPGVNLNCSQEFMQLQGNRFCIKKCFGWLFLVFPEYPWFSHLSKLTVFLFHFFLRLASSPPQGVPPSREVESSY